MTQATTLTPALIRLFGFCCGAIVANIYYAQPIIGLIAPEIGLSPHAASFIVSLNQIGYGLGLFFLVPLGDLVENRRLTLVTVAAALLCLLAAATSHGAFPFLLVALLIGLTSTAVQMLLPLAAHLAEEHKRGQVVGQIMSGLLLGILLARPLSSLIADHFGWRAVFFGAAGLMAGIWLLLWQKIPHRQPSHQAHYGQLILSLKHLFQHHAILRERAFYQACMFASFSLFWSAAPLELAGRFGLSQSQIALFALAGAVGAVAAPFSGRLADRGHTRRATTFALVAGSAVFFAAAGADMIGVLGLAAVGIVLDFCVQMNLVLGQRAIFSLDAASRSRINGIYMTSIFAGGAFGSAIASPLYESGGWGAVACAGGIFPLIAFFAFCTKRRQA